MLPSAILLVKDPAKNDHQVNVTVCTHDFCKLAKTTTKKQIACFLKIEIFRKILCCFVFLQFNAGSNTSLVYISWQSVHLAGFPGYYYCIF